MGSWTPRPEDYQRLFSEQNPWHQLQNVPSVFAPQVERPLAKALWKRLTTEGPERFQIVLGPRRVGKTTAMYQTVRRLLQNGTAANKLWWLRLDHPLLLEIELGELARFVVETSGASRDQPAILLLDELVYAKDWDLWLKTFYDEKWPLQIVATSSATAALRDRGLESGVGRWEEQYLAPYLLNEYLDLIEHQYHIPLGENLSDTIDTLGEASLDLQEIAKARRRLLLTGGFPELLVATKNDDYQQDKEMTGLLQSQRILRSDAIERAVYKDIPQSFGVQSPLLLERMLYALAGETAGLLSPTNICQQLDGLTQPTFDRYLSYLQQAFIVFTLPNYSGSELTIQRRGRKIYFIDSAIRNAALQRGIAPLEDTNEMGILLENAAAAHLHALGTQTQVRIFHWRDGKKEIDLVFAHPTRPLAFEIASSVRHPRSGMEAFVKKYPQFSGNTYLVAPNAPFLHARHGGRGIGTLPLDVYLLAVGLHAGKSLQERL